LFSSASLRLRGKILFGEDYGVVPFDVGRRMAAMIANAHFVTLES
jgi:hypothetical protein